MTKISNFTPHELNFYGTNDVSFDPKIRKYCLRVEASPIRSIQSSGMLSAKISSMPEKEINQIPVIVKKVTGCDPMPDGEGIIIVSALYAMAAQKMGFDMARIYTIADPVFTPDGKTVLGCLGICPAI